MERIFALPFAAISVSVCPTLITATPPTIFAADGVFPCHNQSGLIDLALSVYLPES
jgi:hypothetical protein